jgi:predicted nucleic acid-binding protein
MEINPGAFVPVVAIVYPREHAEAIPAYTDKRKVPTHRADDAVIAAYVRAHRIGALATIPSLVEHDDTLESLMGYQRGEGRPHRRAALYIG